MLQRIQSVFLFLASLSIGGQFFTAFASTQAKVQGLFGDKLYNIYDHPALMTLTILGALVALITIFLFKKRGLQLKLSYLAITLCVLLPIIAIIIFNNNSAQLGNVDPEDEMGLYLPILPIIFIGLAIRAIRKDENLVKSMDRLR